MKIESYFPTEARQVELWQEVKRIKNYLFELSGKNKYTWFSNYTDEELKNRMKRLYNL
jgi:hypothetical protein